VVRFHPSDGPVRIKGVEQTTNAVLHPWLKTELTAILNTLPEVSSSTSQTVIQQTWKQWREGCGERGVARGVNGGVYVTSTFTAITTFVGLGQLKRPSNTRFNALVV